MSYQIIYVSHAKRAFEVPELVELLIKARSTNEKENVTGLLLYEDSTFVQFLEGSKDPVERIIAKIISDPRHECIVYLLRGDTKYGRVFPDWKMGFRHMKFMNRQNIGGLQENELKDVCSMLDLNSHVMATRVLLNIINANGYAAA